MSKKLSEEIKSEAQLAINNPKRFEAIHQTLVEMAEELEATKEEYISIFPRLDFFNDYRGYYASMPFIPQDFDFEHNAVSRPNEPTVDVYHKDGYGVMKMSSGKWLFSKLSSSKKQGEQSFEMEFTINNAFEAFIILKSIGISVPEIKEQEDSPEDFCPRCETRLCTEEKERQECIVCGAKWTVTEEEE